MNFQPIVDFIITIVVLFAIFLLTYCAIRKQGIKDTFEEIMGIGKEKIQEAGEVMKYANR